MKTMEILSNKKYVSATPDSLATLKRDCNMTLFPDSKVTVTAGNAIHGYSEGMVLTVAVRHNGSLEDKIKAFKDIQYLVTCIIMEE